MYLDQDKVTRIQQVIGYWEYCLQKLPPAFGARASDSCDVAALMADIVMSPAWIDYYKGKTRDGRFIMLYDIASELSLPDGSILWRKSRWQHIKKLLSVLKADFGVSHTLPFVDEK